MKKMIQVSYTRDSADGRTLLNVEFDDEQFTHLPAEGRRTAALALMKTAMMLLECREGDVP